MSKIISKLCFFGILFALISCTQYKFFPFVPDENDQTPYDVNTSESFAEMLDTTGQARLISDIEFDFTDDSSLQLLFTDGKNYSIDLNGNELSLISYNEYTNSEGPSVTPLKVDNGASLTIRNGSITMTENSGHELSGGIEVLSGATLILDNVNYTSNHHGIFVDDPNAKLYAIDSTITANGGYAISTNAADDSTGLLIDLNHTTVCATYKEQSPCPGVGILFNVNGTLNIYNNSVIEGGYQAVIARGGYTTIETGSKIYSRGDTIIPKGSEWQYLFGEPKGPVDWGSGNQVAYAALVIGNAQNNAYNYPTTVELMDSEIKIDIKQDINPLAQKIFIASANNQDVKLITNNSDYIQEIINLGEYKTWRGTTGYIGTSQENLTLLSSQP